MKSSANCNSTLPKLYGLCYDQQTIFDYRDSNRLLCMRLDVSYQCNLQCKYCYTRELKVEGKDEQTYDELIDTVEQGIHLGIKSVVLLGGEPLIYPRLADFLEFLDERGIVPVLFTNGLLVDKKLAKKLYDLNVTVIVKFDGFGERQDKLSGEGSFVKIQNGLANLVSVGYTERPSEALRLGCASVVTNVNYQEIPDVWRYLRNNNIYPHIERMTVTSDEKEYLAISTEQAKKLTSNLRRIDEKEYGIRWCFPYPAIPGYNCSIFYEGCHINPYREVSACPELPPVESLREKSLNEIIRGDYFQKTRYIEKYIRGKCSICPSLRDGPCYGCRSKVFRRTGSLFDEDSDCPY